VVFLNQTTRKRMPTTPLVLALQVRAWQAVLLPGHSDAEFHGTQAPAPSQTVPPFWLQAVPAAAKELDGVPAEQASRVH
jgi:hypothetical protein